MSEQVELELNIKGGDKAVKTLGDLEKQLEKAREEIKKVEVGSKAFEKLATEIQQASSEVKTLEKKMEGLEPQQKAEAFLKMGEGIAGGFVAAQGAMGLLGIESENFEKIQAKVQSAIAIAMGVRMMSEAALMATTAKRVIIEKASAAATAINTLATKAATVTLRLFNISVKATSLSLKVLKGAIISTGIGALVIGVVSLVSAMMSYKDSSDEAAKSEERRAKAAKELQKTQRENIDAQMSANRIAKIGREKGIKSAEYLIAVLNDNIKSQEKHLDTLIKEGVEQNKINDARVFLEDLIEARSLF